MVERGEVDFEPGWIHGDHQEKIEQACKRLGMERLKPLKDALPEQVTYDEIRLVARLSCRQQTIRQFSDTETRNFGFATNDDADRIELFRQLDRRSYNPLVR